MAPRISEYPLLSGALLLLFAGTAHAAIVEGTVTDDQKHPLPGAMISVRDDAKGFFETVYTDSAGRYRLNTTQQGGLELRARKLSFADATEQVHLDVASRVTADFSLTILTDPEDIADNLPPSAHFSKIPFDTTGPDSRAAIQMTCTNCHALGTPFNRMPRLPEEWAPVVSRMLTNHVNVPVDQLNDLTLALSNKLAEGFNDELPAHAENQVIDPTLASAKITEWAVRGGIPFPFGIAAYSGDGKLYVADAATPRLLVVDPKSEDVQSRKLTQAVQGIAEGPDGKLYLTSPTLGLLGVLNPKSADPIWHLIGTLSPGTVRVGANGVVWWAHFLDQHGNNNADSPALLDDTSVEGQPAGGRVGRYDPSTGRVTLVELPNNDPGDYVVPSTQPYTFGMAIDPNSGDAWYSKLYANKIGHIDAKTLAVTEFTPPQMGPRGMAFDKQGRLWVAFTGSSSIASLDPATMKWTNYPLPTLAPEETDTPYTVAVNPTTQDVWVSANEAGQMYRFIPAEQRFVTYPMPTRGTWMRDLTFTKDGSVCGTSGPLPPINIEDGDPLVICLDPGTGTN